MKYNKQDYSDLESVVESTVFTPKSKISVIVPFFGEALVMNKKMPHLKEPEELLLLTNAHSETVASEPVVCITANLTNFQKLLLTLTSLASQNYPKELYEIIVAYDGPSIFCDFNNSLDESLINYDITLHDFTLVDASTNENSWGKAQAFNSALKVASGDLVLSLDADMLLHENHLSSLARWFVNDDKIVVFGSKKIVPEWLPFAQSVNAIKNKNFNSIPTSEVLEHEWFVNFITKTNSFKNAGSKVFSIYVGASVMMQKSLIDASGGYDPLMILAEDTELGYRLYNMGAVFIPDQLSQAWHLGMTHMSEHREVLLPHNHALLSHRVPLLTKLRKSKHHMLYKVPTVSLELKVSESNADKFLVLIYKILAGQAGFDAFINVIVPQDFNKLRYSAVHDKYPNLRKLVNSLDGDPRVTCSHDPVNVNDNIPFIMFLKRPVPVEFLKKMFKIILQKDVGVVALPSRSGIEVASIYRVAALNSYDYDLRKSENPIFRSIATSHGFWWVSRMELLQTLRKNKTQTLSKKIKSKSAKYKNKIVKLTTKYKSLPFSFKKAR